MKISIDRNIYGDETISKTIYKLADRYSIARTLKPDNKEELVIMPKENCHEDESQIRNAVIDTLNDYKLRDVIEKETHDIKVILYAKAFGDFDDISESDIE